MDRSKIGNKTKYFEFVDIGSGKVILLLRGEKPLSQPFLSRRTPVSAKKFFVFDT